MCEAIASAGERPPAMSVRVSSASGSDSAIEQSTWSTLRVGHLQGPTRSPYLGSAATSSRANHGQVFAGWGGLSGDLGMGNSSGRSQGSAASRRRLRLRCVHPLCELSGGMSSSDKRLLSQPT